MTEERINFLAARNWRKSRVFHITYSTHYSPEERNLALLYINDENAEYEDFVTWCRNYTERSNGL